MNVDKNNNANSKLPKATGQKSGVDVATVASAISQVVKRHSYSKQEAFAYIFLSAALLVATIYGLIEFPRVMKFISIIAIIGVPTIRWWVQKRRSAPMKKSKIVLIVSGVLLLILAILGPGAYSSYSTVKDCYAFVSKPDAAIKACADMLQVAQRHPENVDPDDAYTVLWLHIAHARMGQNDQQEFERNTAPYLNEKWPAPVISFFLGKTPIEEVFAKAKSGDQSMQNDNICDVNFYLGEWYLENNIKDKAQAAFQAAHSICKPNEITAESVDTELKNLQP